MRFGFIADHVVLDFVATVTERQTRAVDALRGAADLDAWVRESGLADDMPPVSEAGMRRALAVREAAFALFSAVIDGTPPNPADLGTINTAAATAPPTITMGRAGDAHRSGGLDAVLAAIARDCIELLAGPDRALLHWCADPTCTRPFVDRSRGTRRRWCGMRGCGDRAKAAAYRRRRAAGADPGEPSRPR